MLVSIIRFIALALLAAWCFILTRPLIPLALWGAILAVALYPVFQWLSRHLGNRQKLAAILIVCFFIFMIVGPLSLIASAVLESIQTFAHNLENGTVHVPPPPSELSKWPLIGDPLLKIWQDAHRNFLAVIELYRPQLSNLATKLLSLAGATSLGLIQFVFSIIISGFFMLNAAAISEGIHRFTARLVPDRGPEFLILVVATIRNVTRGVIGIALLQTFLLSIGLFLAKVPFAQFLIIGFLLLSILQIGPTILVIPVIIYEWSKLAILPALLFTAWMVLASLCDNFLKPILMARGLPVPILVIFIGVIGGTLSHGLIGLFIGPVILAVGYEVLRAWVNEEDEEQIAQGKQV